MPSCLRRLLRDLPPLFWCQLLGSRRPALLAAEPAEGDSVGVLAGLTFFTASSLLYNTSGDDVHVLGTSLLA